MFNWETAKLVIKVLLTVALIVASVVLAFIFFVLLLFAPGIYVFFWFFIPTLIPFLWLKKRRSYLITYCSLLLVLSLTTGVQIAIAKHEEDLIIDVTPNINTGEYLPFTEDSKIVKYDSKTLKLTEDLPIIDGATAAFPVYSAFVNAVYPNTTELYDGVFEYNNTVGGYEKLAKQKTDIFIGAQPSKEQVEYAAKYGTAFEYTQIGWEAFVFFVHKDNPIDSLTAEQIRGIYSGEITNWSQVGGSDEEIAAFQRNEGSGSQSMMLRFMGDTPIMKAETKEIRGMGEIIEEVVDYKSKSGSIGFSFRYYVEGIIRNPDIKLIAVDGIAPTVENIKSRSYPIIAPVYAVTYADNPNENVYRLIEWMLSDEGQYIIEETGYVGIKN